MRRCENSTGESKFLATRVAALGMTLIIPGMTSSFRMTLVIPNDLVIPGSHLPAMRRARQTGSPPVTELFI
jgi:hypothetical protein